MRMRKRQRIAVGAPGTGCSVTTTDGLGRICLTNRKKCSNMQCFSIPFKPQCNFRCTVVHPARAAVRKTNDISPQINTMKYYKIPRFMTSKPRLAREQIPENGEHTGSPNDERRREQHTEKLVHTESHQRGFKELVSKIHHRCKHLRKTYRNPHSVRRW